MGFSFRYNPGGNQGDGAKPAGVGAKLMSTLAFGFFLAMGLLFAGLIVHEFGKNLATRRWRETPCVIVSSSLGDDPQSGKPVVVLVEYKYQAAGTDRTSRQYKAGYSKSDSVGAAQAVVAAYKPGTQTFCRVNPANPDEAVLAQAPLGMIFIILLPAVFILIGGGGIYGVWFGKTGADGKPAGPVTARASRGQKFMTGFGMLFVLVGLALVWFLTVRPALRVLGARSWKETPCVILSSRVASHSDSDGTTYSIDIVYKYTAGGAEWRSERYDFVGGSSSGRDGKQAVVSRYPPGSDQVCYVDPAKPASAVLDRGFRPVMLAGLLGLLFSGAGLLVMRAGRGAAAKAAWAGGAVTYKTVTGAPAAAAERMDGRLPLKAKQSPLGCLLMALFFALFWNGIVSVFVHEAWTSWKHGSPQWGLMLFLVPFVLIGAGFVCGVFYALLGLFNPRAQGGIRPGTPRVGEAVSLDYSFTGPTHKMRSLKITLEGTEKATYRRGTDTTTDSSIFFQKELFQTTRQSEIRKGAVEFAIPEPAMHSFKSAHNEIEWLVRVEGDIPGRPDVKTEYAVTVMPKAVAGGRA